MWECLTPRIPREIAAIVRLEEPRSAIRVVAEQFFILRRAEIARPDDTRVIDIVGVVDPFHVKDVARRIMDEDQQLAGHFRQPPTVKQHLAALRMLFDWLVTGRVLDVNPAHAVRGPKYVVKKGKTPVLTADEARELLDSIAIARNMARDGSAETHEPAPIASARLARSAN